LVAVSVARTAVCARLRFGLEGKSQQKMGQYPETFRALEIG
jgi:hypothetical protein